MPDTPNSNDTKPPAYFLSLTVQDFRCFGPEPQTLTLKDNHGDFAKWTIILGENGTGKTSLLLCLVMMQPGVFDVNEPGYWPSGDGEAFVLHRYLAMEGQLGDTISATFLVKNASDRDLPGEVGTFGVGRNLNGIPRYTELEVSGLICYGYGAMRRMSALSLSEHGASSRCRSLYHEDTPLLNAEEWLISTDYATKTGTEAQRQRAKERYEKIKAIFVGKGQGTGLLPDVEDFRFTVTDDNAMTPRVEALTPYGWVRVRDLSLGYQAALAWIIDFANRLFERYPNSENPLAEPAICLVDEIDLHLHPRWQRELLRVLSDTFPKTQFIVTAHSPLIVQAAPDANIALLRREGDHVVIENDLDYIRKWRVDQILASDLFGEVAVHHPEVEQRLQRRTDLLQKGRLTKPEKEELATLEDELDHLPTSVLPEDRRAMDIVREAAMLLRSKNGK